MQLEKAKILRPGRIRRAAEKGCERPDVPDIVVVRLLNEVAHRHVFDHAPAQRADGLITHRGAPVLRWRLIDPSILKTERPPVTCARSKSYCGRRNRPTAPPALPAEAGSLCAGHAQQLGGESLLPNLMASVLTHSFASRFCDGQRFFGSAVLCEDGFGAGGPLEGLWVLVSMLDPLVNRGLEFGDVVEGSSPDALASDFGEEPLDEVEPGTGCRREVQCEAFVSHQPALHGRRLVGGVVVEDQMQIEMCGRLAGDCFQKRQELVCPMACQTFADDGT